MPKPSKPIKPKKLRCSGIITGGPLLSVWRALDLCRRKVVNLILPFKEENAMGFEVYDCRRDIRNILVRPQIPRPLLSLGARHRLARRLAYARLGRRDIHHFIGSGGVQNQRRGERSGAGANVLRSN